ncbi:WD40-repeat-containing domain protein, partial [Mycena galopus ATCC 62051]
VSSVGFSPDGGFLVSGSWDTTVRVWDVIAGQVHSILRGHTGKIQMVHFSPSGQNIVSSSADKTVRVWNINAPIQSPNVHPFFCVLTITDFLQFLPQESPLKLAHGWVSSDTPELLFWLPPNHRIGPHTGIQLVIGKERTLLSYENFVHGVEWTK